MDDGDRPGDAHQHGVPAPGSPGGNHGEDQRERKGEDEGVVPGFDDHGALLPLPSFQTPFFLRASATSLGM